MKKVKCDSSVDYEDSVIEGREWADDACRQLVKKKDKILEIIDDIVESDMLIIEGYAYGDKPSITEGEAQDAFDDTNDLLNELKKIASKYY